MAVTAILLTLLATACSSLTTEYIPLLQGKNFTLNCTVENASQSFQDDISWTKNGELLPDWTSKPVYRQRQVQLDDSGVYACNVTSRMYKQFEVMVGDTPVARGKSITLKCSEVDVNRNTSSFIIWSKNGEILENQTESTYTLSKVQFKDSGHYTCNKSGTENKNVVVVGDKPAKPPEPTCLNSANTTIWCFSNVKNIQPNEMCLYFKEVSRFGGETRDFGRPSRCIQEEMELIDSIDLDRWGLISRYEVNTTVRNDFGQSSSIERLRLPRKVTPDPPVNVKLEATGANTFSCSFDILPSWKLASNLEFEYTAIDAETRVDKTNMKALQSPYSSNTYTVKFEIMLKKPDLPPYSLVCVTVKIKFKHYDVHQWSNSSEKTCNYTETKAPSSSPQNVSVTDERAGPNRSISLQWQPPPKEARIIESYKLVIIETSTSEKVLDDTLSGKKTKWRSNSSVTLDPFKDYKIKLAASNSKGNSPFYEHPLRAKSRNIVLFVVIGVICLAGFFILTGVGWKVEQKISSRHLPEPANVIPQSQMKFLLSRKPPSPREKEVFDDLNCPVQDVQSKEEHCRTEDELSTISKESATKQEVPGLINDGYIRRDSGDVACVKMSESFSDVQMQLTPLDLTPSDSLLVFTFPDADQTKSTDNAEVTGYVSEESCKKGPLLVSTDGKEILGKIPEATHYVADDDIRVTAKLGDDPSYENYFLPFKIKVFKKMRQLNAKF